MCLRLRDKVRGEMKKAGALGLKTEMVHDIDERCQVFEKGEQDKKAKPDLEFEKLRLLT